MKSRSNPATATPPANPWLMFALCAGAICTATVLGLAEEMWVEVVYRLAIEGGVATIWLLSAAGIGGKVLRTWGISSNSKPLQFATAAALGLGTFSLVVLGLGLIGWLNRPVAVVMLALGLTAGAVHLPVSTMQFWRLEWKSTYWLWLLVVPVAAMVIVAAFVLPGVLWGDEPHGYDVLEYHLQAPREWFELGRIAPLPHNAFSYFPFNVEMHYLLAMHLRGGPWSGMYLAQLMHVIFVGLTVVAISGIAKPQAAIAAALVPWMAMLGPVAYNEGGLLLFGTLAIVWMVRSDGQLKHMILAGVMAGFACGTKLTGGPLLLFAVPVGWLIARSLSFRERAGVRGQEKSEATGHQEPPHPNPLPKGEGVRGALIFVFAGMITFSPWLIRNAIWTRNPVFPEGTSTFGKAHFTDVQAERWSKAHSRKDDQAGLVPRLAAGWNEIVFNWRYGYFVLPLVVAAGILTWKSQNARFLTVLLLPHLIFWLGFTHLQGRFFILSIPIGVILLSQINWPWWNGTILAVGITAGVFGFTKLDLRVKDKHLAIGLENHRAVMETIVTDSRIWEPDQSIVLVGDAQAFRYPVPMSKLKYRTVFDVNTFDGDSVFSFVRAWAPGALPEKSVILIFPAELERFSTTYWKLPAPDPQWGTKPFIYP